MQHFLLSACNDSEIPQQKSTPLAKVSFHLIKSIHYFSPKQKRYLIAINATNHLLTRQEYAVFCHLIIGLTAKQIARRLHLSPHTIEWHTRNILQIFSLNHKQQLPEFALQHGLMHLWLSYKAQQYTLRYPSPSPSKIPT